MDEKLHRYLDKELLREDLTPSELQEAEAYSTIIAETERAYRSVEVPDLTARVMTHLPDLSNKNTGTDTHSETGSLRRILQSIIWLWKPRPVRLRPAYGVIGLVFLAAILLKIGTTATDHDVARTRNEDVVPVPGKVFVQFRLDAPRASQVRLAGSFTNWAPSYSMDQVSPGIWSVLVPLNPGVHNYAFVVNGGEWVADPAAPAVADGFGGVNSRISLLLPGGTSRL